MNALLPDGLSPRAQWVPVTHLTDRVTVIRRNENGHSEGIDRDGKEED